jgi:hypothetical protein
MPLLVGVLLAIGVALFVRLVGFDRERSFYPVVLIVIAALYVLFAVMGGTGASVKAELIPFVLFCALALAGFRISLWFAAGGLVLHGIFDLLRAPFLPNSGVPEWWPQFCSAYDIAAGIVVAALLVAHKVPSGRRRTPLLPGA